MDLVEDRRRELRFGHPAAALGALDCPLRRDELRAVLAVRFERLLRLAAGQVLCNEDVRAASGTDSAVRVYACSVSARLRRLEETVAYTMRPPCISTRALSCVFVMSSPVDEKKAVSCVNEALHGGLTRRTHVPAHVGDHTLEHLRLGVGRLNAQLGIPVQSPPATGSSARLMPRGAALRKSSWSARYTSILDDQPDALVRGDALLI